MINWGEVNRLWESPALYEQHNKKCDGVKNEHR